MQIYAKQNTLSKEDSALFHAAEVANIAEIKQAIENSADVNAQDNMGRSALHIAVSENNMQIAELLLKAGADSNLQDRYKDTPLHYAARHGNKNIALLLIKYGANTSAKNALGLTAWNLQRKISKIDTEEEKILTKEQEHEYEELLKREYYAPLNCILKGDISGLHAQIRNGININTKDWNGDTLLSRAVNARGSDAYTKFKIVQMLIIAGADVNTRIDDGYTPLYNAICSGNDKIVSTLMDAGADIDVQSNSGITPIYCATLNGNRKIVEDLILAGSDVNIKEYRYGFTPLNRLVADESESDSCWQADEEHLNLVKLLVDAKADVNTRDKKGNTPLHYVWSPDTAKMLLEAGAEVNAVNSYGHTALHTAVFEHKIEIIKLLIDAGADVNAKDNEGITPYMLAYKKAEIDILLAGGADKEEEAKFIDRIIASGKDINTYQFCNSYGGRTAARVIHLVKSVNNLKKLIAAEADVNAEFRKNIMRKTYDTYEILSPICLAVENENAEILTLLIESGADVHINYHYETEDYYSKEDFESNIPPLAMALKNNSAKIVEILINAGVDVNDATVFGSGIKGIDGYDNTLVIEDAIKYADSGCLKMLIKAGVKIDDYVLEDAVRNGDAEKVRLLIAAGRNPKAAEWFVAKQLGDAVRQNDLAKIKQIIATGADVNAVDKEGNTALHKALHEFFSSDVSVDGVQFLIDAGAKINTVNNYGETALHFSINRSSEITEFLLEQGADVNAQDANGRTPLHEARDETIVALLIDHGANVNAKDKDGRSPLHACFEAVFHMKLATAKLLIKNGADINAQDDEGKTPLHLAYSINVALAHILIEHGADVNIKDSNGKTAEEYRQAHSDDEVDIPF